MSNVTRETLLSSLRLVRDADGNVSLCGPDGDHVIAVRGNLGLGLSAHQIGLWVADACHQAARTCKTCYWSIVSTAHEPEGGASETYALCFHPDASIPRIRFALEHRCDHWYSKEDTDASMV